MKRITAGELEVLLRKHKLWLDNKEAGERANLRGADLRWVDLRSADLRSADLRGVDLGVADLREANLRGADLRWADLRWANFRGADLRSADLSGVNLREADLRSANLGGANLSGANLDYSCLPLWCGSLSVQFDDRQTIQIAYHLVKAGLQSKNTSEETKTELKKLIDFANKFHRVEECGLIDAVESEDKS